MGLETYSKRSQFYTGEVPSRLGDLLGQTKWDSLVDLGCGDGALLSALESEGYLSDKSIYAVDLSPTRIDLVRSISDRLTCLVADVCDTGIPDASVDFLITSQVIEHVENDEDMAREMWRITSPGGTVYLSTIFKKWYGWYFYRCNGKWTIDPTHLREYTEDNQLLRLLSDQGFQVVYSHKTPDGRALVDTVLRRLPVGRNIFHNGLLKLLRKIRMPIPGYSIWEVALRKQS